MRETVTIPSSGQNATGNGIDFTTLHAGFQSSNCSLLGVQNRRMDRGKFCGRLADAECPRHIGLIIS